ncbi:hypothetical protein JCM9279_006996 [Rhodotorula babjevae]
MCGSMSKLFFGITVRALDLVIAARHWAHRQAVLRALDSISALRERGQLKVELGADGRSARIAEVPGEVWALVKAHVVPALWDEAEHAFVSHVHDAGKETCSCVVCARAAGRTAVVPAGPLRKLSHIDECVDCSLGLLRLQGLEDILIVHEQDIDTLLAALALELVDTVPISHGAMAMPRLDVYASVAISLPNVARTDSDAPHGTYDFDHDVVEIDPRFFLVPRDAQDRFKRLLRLFSLAESHEQQGKVSRGHSRRWAPDDSDGRAGGLPQTTAGGKSSRAEGGPGKWLLWGCVCDCGT